MYQQISPMGRAESAHIAVVGHISIKANLL